MNPYLKKLLLCFMAFIMFLPALFIFASEAEAKKTRVKGYYRGDGTYVRGHYRDTGGSGGSSYSSPYTGSQNLYKTGNVVNLYKGKNYMTSKEASSLVFVQGYYRDNGVYVRPHYRTHANNFIKDNLSYSGLSSLLPLTTKYPSFSYSSEPTTLSAERYLLGVVLPYSLNQTQMSTLKEYASKLASQDKTALNYGVDFYQSLGFSLELAQSQAKFDGGTPLNLDTYLYFVLIQQGKNYLTTDQRAKFETYKSILKAAKIDPTKKGSAQSAGRTFYQSIGLGFSLSYDQVEMDLLQDDATLALNEEPGPVAPTAEQKAFFDFAAYPNSIPTFEAYLRTVLKTYSLNKDYSKEFELTSYAITLHVYSSSLEYSFSKDAIYRKGLSFYKYIGLTEEAAKKQAESDYNAVYAAFLNR